MNLNPMGIKVNYLITGIKTKTLTARSSKSGQEGGVRMTE